MKLVTWNIQSCCGVDGRVQPERIVDTARALADFDVLCVQEVADNHPGLLGAPRGDQSEQLAKLLPGFRLFAGWATVEWDAAGQRSRFGNAIATRLPALQVQHHPLPSPSDPGHGGMPRMCSVLTVDAPELGPVRIMTTHLEYYSARRRAAQVRRLRELHIEACGLAADPRGPDEPGTPFRRKPDTPHALLCGDFNMPAGSPELEVLQEPFEIGGRGQRLWDCWPLVHGARPQDPTFALYDHTYEPQAEPFDFWFASESLKERARGIAVDAQTQASDHQPVLLELD